MRRAGKIAFVFTNWRYFILYRKFKNYTMTPAVQFIQNMLLAEQFRDRKGAVVECGVWKGGMIAGLVEIMGKDREYYLYDSFEGLPPAKDIDGEAAKKWQANTESEWYHDNCSAEEKYAREAMNRSGTKNYHIKKGWFVESLPEFPQSKEIALLRLDGDWYESTFECLKQLFPKVCEGGLIIIDDYDTWEGCTKAVNDFLSLNQRPEKVMRFQHTVCYLVKKSA